MISERPLHKTMPGAVVEQYRKVRGKTYGPYWVRVWREGGRVRKSYVMPHELGPVRAACETNRRNRQRLARRRAEIRRTLSDFSFFGRLLARMERQGDDGFTVSDAERDRIERQGGIE